MPVDASTIRTFAGSLSDGKLTAAGCKDEVVVRTVHSRAYYAAYHAVVEASRAARGLPKFEADHAPLIEFLAASPDALLRDNSVRLNTLRNARRTADYDLRTGLSAFVNPVLLRLADEVLADAGRMETLLRTTDTRPLPNRMKKKRSP